MDSKKAFLFALMAFFALASVVFATVTVPATMRYREILPGGAVSDTATPVTGVSAIGFVCSSANCATVNSALDLSSGTLADVNNPPVLSSGSSDSMNIVYPTISQSSFGYGVYVYKEGYIGLEVNATWYGTGVAPARTYYLAKKQSCFATVANFTVVNDAYENIPLVVNVEANLSADTLAAIRSAGPLEFVPPQLLDVHYSVNTSITLVIKNSTGAVVQANTTYVMIPYSGSKHVAFTWTPAVNGTYTANVTTGVPDAKCIQDSVIPQAESKAFTVWPSAPKNACYTILNTLSFSPAFPNTTGAINFTFNKISNYANNFDIWNPLYDLIPAKANVTYRISNSTAEVFSQNATLSANPNNSTPVYFNFSWTPVAAGNYTAEVRGIADDAQCAGVTNPTEAATTTFVVSENILDTTPPDITITSPTNDQAFSTSSITVSGTASDDTALSKVEVKVDGGSWQLATGTTSWSSPATLASGSNNIYAKATDTSGNSKEALVTVTFTPPPTCTRANPSVALSPVSQSGIHGQILQYTISVTNNDNAPCGASIFNLSGACPAGWACSTNASSAIISPGIADTSAALGVTSSGSAAAGTYAINATAVNSGNSSYNGTGAASYVVVVDTTPPGIIITSPANGQAFSTSAITVTGTSSDNVAVSNVTISVNGGAFQLASGTASWSFAATLASGSNTITANATDTSGNTNQTSISVTYTPPGGGGGGSSGGGGGPAPSGGGYPFFAYGAASNAGASFSELLLPDAIYGDEELTVSGCIQDIGIASNITLYVDGSKKDEAEVNSTFSCFSLSGGMLDVGYRLISIGLGNAGPTFSQLVNVIQPLEKKKLRVLGISVPDKIYSGAEAKIIVFVESSVPENVNVVLYYGDGVSGTKKFFVAGKSAIDFRHTFAPAGKKALRVEATSKSGSDSFSKEIEVREPVSGPTGMAIAGRSRATTTILIISALGILAGAYYLISKGYLSGVIAKVRIFFQN